MEERLQLIKDFFEIGSKNITIYVSENDEELADLLTKNKIEFDIDEITIIKYEPEIINMSEFKNLFDFIRLKDIAIEANQIQALCTKYDLECTLDHGPGTIVFEKPTFSIFPSDE
jgi:hypothetical protein